MISRSPRATTFRFPMLFMAVSPLALATSALLLRFELVEQGIQALEVALPAPAIVLQPPGRLRERPGLEAARPSLGVAPARDQPGPLEHLEVLGDRRLADLERGGQLRHRGLAGGQAGEDRPPRRIG